MRAGLGFALVVATGCVSQPMGGVHIPAWVSDTSSYGTAAATEGPIADRSQAVASKIIAAARADRGAYAKLAQLTDGIGHRLSGSHELELAIAWAQRTLEADGHTVRTEPVMVPHWVRGAEDAAIVSSAPNGTPSPVGSPLHIIGLGGTVPTPKGGLVAQVVVVRSWDELEHTDVKGKLVLFDVAMPPWTEANGSGYGDVAPFRSRGPSRAAKAGAVGVLMRSITAHSLRLPHTGAVNYDPAQPKIPAAAVTVEDSLRLVRLAAQGPVMVRLHLESQQLPDAASANVIGELRGRDKPDEIVVLGAHLDSWDVGQGAHDDGAGVVTMMQALTTLRRLGLTPRRTIRVVLFTNEENGLRGGKGYALAHASELARTVLAVESDSGGFAPRGFSVETKPELTAAAVARFGKIATLLGPINATRVIAGHGGSDISPMVEAGVPTLGLDVDNRTYFDIHHTEADTLDKVDPAQLADDVAAVAVLAYIVADE